VSYVVLYVSTHIEPQQGAIEFANIDRVEARNSNGNSLQSVRMSVQGKEKIGMRLDVRT